MSLQLPASAVFTGKALEVHLHPKTSEGFTFAELCFHHKEASVNKFDLTTLTELSQGLAALTACTQPIHGLMVTSAKDVFIVGADIGEFLPRFAASDSQLSAWLEDTHQAFNQVEDLPYPSVTLINGVCLGGGFEMALTTAYRLTSTQASLGLPETKLGIYPGWGGTIRLPRLIGADHALEWIAGGGAFKPMDALKVGSVDGVMEPQHLRSGGIQLLTRAAQGSLPWQERQHQKKRPLQLLSDIEHSLVFESARGFVLGQVGTHYPAPLEAIQTIERSAKLDRTGARPIEIAGFVKLAKTPVAENLITLFLADQFNKKKTKALIKQVSPLHQAAVLGAGIMGGGIAYQSASKGTPILMKDITPKALALGLGEAVKLLSKQVERKKLSPEDMARTMGAITPTLSYGDFGPVQIAIEAVIENEAIKISVLKELESHTSPECILASNTSTISISRLGASLSRPDKFCGMHFFNPVHKMPLVEIIRGDKTCDQTIAAVVDYALKMGKLPIVVQDCPGFLVNRVLFPYFYGFMKLIEDGVDFVRIDKLMESFGWPMGPAYLLDVIGLDTGVHAGAVMAKAFPDRMGFSKTSAMGVLVDQKRLGQKSGFGFYRYVFDKKGSPKKHFDPETQSLLAPFVKPSRQVVSDESLSDESIIDRMMLPMILETALCLQERIVATPMEADLALIHGLGFPPFRGGVLKYADGMGLGVLCERSRAFEGLGNCYKPGALVQQLAQKHQLFYTQMG